MGKLLELDVKTFTASCFLPLQVYASTNAKTLERCVRNAASAINSWGSCDFKGTSTVRISTNEWHVHEVPLGRGLISH